MLRFIMVLVCAINIFATEVVDIVGRKVILKDDVKKVALTFYFEEYFTVTGVKGVDNIVAWSTKYWEGRRQSSYDAFIQAFPKLKNIPDIGYGPKKTLSFEKIIAIKPEVVIFPRILYEYVKPNIEILNKANIPIVFIDFHDENLQTHMKSMEILGKIFHQEEKVKKINEFYKSKFELVQNRLSNVDNLKLPKVYVEFSEKAGAEQIGGTWDDKMWGAFVRLAGGKI